MVRRLRGQRGQGLIEFVVVFPFLVFFLFAIFDIGTGLNRQATLQHATREGARWGAISDNVDDVRQQTANASRGLVDAGSDCQSSPPPCIRVCYDGPNDPNFGPGDAVNVQIDYAFHPKLLGSALSLFGGVIGDPIIISIKGSSRLERSLQGVNGARGC